jgi:C1A family cysteine protease
MVTGRPISITVSAGNSYWQSYANGIMNVCGNGPIDHGVTLVGVYQDATQNYWKVKNSWGKTWGENGYVRIDRNQDNLCKICSFGFYPVL